MTRASSCWSPPAAPARCSRATSRWSSRSPSVLVPPLPGDRRRHRTAGDRPAARVRRHRAPRARRRRPRPAAQRAMSDLSAQADRQLEQDGVPEDRRMVRLLADCRYVGQGYEVRFDVPAGEIDDRWLAELRRALPPGPRGRVRPPLRGRHRARQRPRGGDRRRSPTCRPSRLERGDGVRRAR